MTATTSSGVRVVVGQAIAERRKFLALTQAEVARRVGMSRASVANMERGWQEPNVTAIYKLAIALDCEPKDLLP